MINYNNSSEAQKEYIQGRIDSEIYCTMNDVVQDNQWEMDYIDNAYSDVCASCGAENEDECECDNYEQTYQEVLEWYFVSERLGNKLYEIGEPIERNFQGKALWGRTCSGQAIILDSTFWEVFQDGVKNV